MNDWILMKGGYRVTRRDMMADLFGLFSHKIYRSLVLTAPRITFSRLCRTTKPLIPGACLTLTAPSEAEEIGQLRFGVVNYPNIP
jgi:hypothetical protein